jgi:hypothetical protein
MATIFELNITVGTAGLNPGPDYTCAISNDGLLTQSYDIPLANQEIKHVWYYVTDAIFDLTKFRGIKVTPTPGHPGFVTITLGAIQPTQIRIVLIGTTVD